MLRRRKVKCRWVFGWQDNHMKKPTTVYINRSHVIRVSVDNVNEMKHLIVAMSDGELLRILNDKRVMRRLTR